MKLKKIKLSGFKSFVDPTAIHLQSNLTGVVGPNGCGKSNIIDAVRWVMGEISAKQLRGESMSDVIFNGSSTRKPVGQAAVELIFDNSDASLGGEYAKYNEISIRREVNRDGFSDYFLNNTSCRRKDITNIFLGTGLGPNSYAIIEQGVISQFIEAKPDELRVVIEEAAGISKYKERRRETENRIKHTKENLLRLNDIREELDKQLKHLKAQANAAERYKKLKYEERLAKAELHTLHWREIDKKLVAQADVIKNDETLLENKITELHVFGAKIAELREQHNIAIEKFNEVQGNYYRIGANIARLEQQIHHTKERREQLAKDLSQIDQGMQEITSHQEVDQSQIALLKEEKNQLDVNVVELQATATKAQQELEIAEQQMQLWQNDWDDFNTSSAKVLQLLEVEQTRITHLEQKIVAENHNLEKLKSELSNLDFVALTSEVEQLHSQFGVLHNAREKIHQDIVKQQQQITLQRENGNKLAVTLDQIRNKLQVLIGRKSSLEALQQAALGKNDTVVIDWLKQQQLEEQPRLAEKMRVTAGWETAVETVLGVYLEAVCVAGISHVVPAVSNLARGNLTLFEFDNKAQFNPRLNAPTLMSKIISDLPVSNLLSGVYVAADITEALELQSQLNCDESVITKDGMWLGSGWLRVSCDTGQKAGTLQRERELQEINESIAKEQQACILQEQELAAQQTILTTLEQGHQELQKQLHTITAEYSDIQSQTAAKKTYLQHLEERAASLKKEIEVSEKNLLDEREQLAVLLKNNEEISRQKNTDDTQRQRLVVYREQMQKELLRAREHAQKTKQDAADLVMRLQLLETQVSYLTQSLERANQRLVSLKEQRINVEKSLSKAESPLLGLEKDLQVELEQRLAVEANLALAKQQTVDCEQELRGLEQRYFELQETNEQIRVGLEKLRAERQGLEVRAATYKEQVAELELQLDTLNPHIPEIATIIDWEEKLAHLAAKIERLGLINLAAIEEFEKLQERKNYLDTQNQDLVNALNTLEEAMRKIDHDTKERFQEAYQSINQKFQELFPKIFNGGKAYLEQTTSNMLDTGILIMAQPPGKRNASIHLLSGGEKALTAIALIFAIFHLTPAPFCMLDEVDAPLDDVNVLRFCNLVKEMGQLVQFIFVTHNKLTMEIAEQLLGITMQEAGVSRMVSVDIDTAVSMAGAEK